ncbi:RAxF-45 family protein [Bacillus massilinigeriensis]|nr:RAxF-45 family protein [Bacillus massilionigeriensis]
MNQAVLLSHVNDLDFLCICRGKFAAAVVNGISLPFFNNRIARTKR